MNLNKYIILNPYKKEARKIRLNLQYYKISLIYILNIVLFIQWANKSLIKCLFKNKKIK